MPIKPMPLGIVFAMLENLEKNRFFGKITVSMESGVVTCLDKNEKIVYGGNGHNDIQEQEVTK